ncbi:MAG: phosphoribosylanthranilate isomerase [Clostridiales Family XIII bacterium]|nr:phosphoribosylanthranilate isomerase [Clostridiales Family XIII bacterium]
MKLKICGNRTIDDIDCLNRAGVDFCGFVFAEHPQKITLETAKRLKERLNPRIETVGAFLDEPYEYVKEVVESGVVDYVQFHGSGTYSGLPVKTIKSFIIPLDKEFHTECDFVLFDAFRRGVRGSTGGMFDWRLIADYDEKPFFLAGGINESNIGEAIGYGPYCIDVSSGAESDGRKDLQKILKLRRACDE